MSKETTKREDAVLAMFMVQNSDEGKYFGSKTVMPNDVRGILAAFVQYLARTVNVKAATGIVGAFRDGRRDEMLKWPSLFDHMDKSIFALLENDYEDINQDDESKCPLCNHVHEAPFNYVSIRYASNAKKDSYFVISLTVLTHLLLKHDFTVPAKFAGFIMSNYFTGYSIIKPMSDMTPAELIAEINERDSVIAALNSELNEWKKLVDDNTLPTNQADDDSDEPDDDLSDNADDDVELDADGNIADVNELEEEDSEDEDDGEGV